MSNEIRVHGPPGTGKTQKLAEEIIPSLVDKYGEDKVMLTSFTKAAAQELGQRVDLKDSKITGTLHSICFQALGCPKLTEDKIKDWNARGAKYALNNDDNKDGTICHSRYQVLRNKQIDRNSWPKEITNFATEWENWKKEDGLMDFIDLIEEAGKQYSAPGSPSAIVIDEAQDFTKLEMTTLRGWATQAQEFWVVGDDDQAIFCFSGADPRNMLFPEIPQSQKIILGQSYRIPRQVHTIADKIIGRVKLREPKVYLPRPAEGVITRCGDTLGNPDWVIKEALRLPGTSMILASCNYMLAKLIKQLRDEGIAFSNPWRPEEKSWNPLSQSGTALLNNFLDTGPDDSYWTTEQFLTWADFISVGPEGVIRKQGKEGLKQMRAIMEEDPFTPGLHTCREYIDCILSPGALVPALDRNVEWLKDNLTKAKATVLQYPARVLMKHGQTALREKPKIVVGTVHSVKGAGAENVFIYPDISLASSYECQTKEGYENLCRLFYVGVTRTKENLYIMAPESRSFFSM